MAKAYEVVGYASEGAAVCVECHTIYCHRCAEGRECEDSPVFAGDEAAADLVCENCNEPLVEAFDA